MNLRYDSTENIKKSIEDNKKNKENIKKVEEEKRTENNIRYFRAMTGTYYRKGKKKKISTAERILFTIIGGPIWWFGAIIALGFGSGILCLITGIDIDWNYKVVYIAVAIIAVIRCYNIE